MEWIDVNDRLPDEGEYVLVYAGNYIQKVKYDIARISLGISMYDRQRMIDGIIPNPTTPCGDFIVIPLERSSIITGSDEHGNNLKPYDWHTFGPMKYFGQDVTHWMPLPAPPTVKGGDYPQNNK